MDLLQNFRNKQIIRAQISCSDELSIWLDHLQYSIHLQFDKNSKNLYKFKKRKKQVNANFRNAIQNLNRQQKVQFYIRLVTHLQSFYKGKQSPPQLTQTLIKPIEGQCQTRSFNLKIWKLKKIRIDRSRHQIMVQKDDKIKSYQLRNYILRKSKIRDMYLFVLQAINDKPHQKSRQVHISFKDQQTLKKWYQLVKEQVQYCQWLNVRQLYNSMGKVDFSLVSQYKTNKEKSLKSSFSEDKSQSGILDLSKSQSTIPNKQSFISSKDSQIDQDKLFLAEQQLDKEEHKLNANRKTFIDHLVNDDGTNVEEMFDQIENQSPKQVQQKKNLDFFHKLMPQYEISQLCELGGYQTLQNEQNFKILHHLQNVFHFKLLIEFAPKLTPHHIFSLISQPHHNITCNDNISQLHIKTMLKSQNSAILYQTLKAYNKFYRSRDFIMVRHTFRHGDGVFMVDKSIDNMNYPPFITLVRADVSVVWGIYKQKDNTVRLIGDFNIVNSGLLNNQQELNLSLKYLNGFKLMLKHQLPSIQTSMFDLDWNIDKKQQNKKTQDIRVRRKTIQLEKQKIVRKQHTNNNTLNPQPNFQKKSSSTNAVNSASSSPQTKAAIKQIQINQTYQSLIPINPKPNQPQPPSPSKKPSPINPYTTQHIIRKLNKDQYVILDNSYVNKRFITQPIKKEDYKYQEVVKGHPIWKGDWIHDQKNGAIIFVNQKKIEDQKGVLKFILTKIGKNILSGKSVLNISLPVDIFAPQSNLQRFLLSMSYGPKLLQGLCGKSPLQKLMSVVNFGMTNSILYLNMQKPFNPILGQTFQCWINGCPGYAQQISHHPPIAAMMFLGRGYRVTCQLESKVQLHMNSGCGINDGVYRVRFQDGQEVCFITAGGEVSGLTYGDRKFNLVGKAYYWMEKQRIFVEILFDAGKKGFFSKQQKPSDYFEGKVYQVTSQFLQTFIKSKKRDANQKQRVKQLGRFDGIWNKYIRFNDKQIFNLDQNYPLRLEYQSQPLASDANWRQDIEYRRLNKTTKAQTQKQRLQVVQRTDRKFRDKYKKK